MRETMSSEELMELRALQQLNDMRGKAGKIRKTYDHDDFLFDTQQDAFWCLPTSSLISAMAVNSLVPMEIWRIPMRENPNARGRPPQPVPPARDVSRIESGTVVEGSTWLPGSPKVIDDLYVSADGFFPLLGARTYNTFRPGPELSTERASEAQPWIDHIKKLWPVEEEHEYFFNYCAHMVQRPEEKCNAAIVLSGKQGIGKDAALIPLRKAVGEWNCRNINPDALLARFNPWVECVMLTIDEVRSTKDDHSATSMYNSLKALTTTPPNTLPLEDKGSKVRYVANVLRIFMTTNDRLSMYIPPEDRRIMMLHSDLPQRWHEVEGRPDYFEDLFSWLESDGWESVAAWLKKRDLSGFKNKGHVPKTEAWGEIGQRWSEPDDEVAQALDMLGYPDSLLSSELTEQLFDGAEDLRRAMKGGGFIFRMQKAGYRLMPLPEGQRSWRLEQGGFIVKANKAYVKDSLGLSIADAREKIAERLKLRVEAGPSGKVAPQHLKVVKTVEGF